MTEELENHTLRLLQAMRAENSAMHEQTRADLLQVLQTVVEVTKSFNAVELTQVEHMKHTKELAARTTMLEVRMGQMQSALDRLTFTAA